ncbi:MAG: MMPL family transporter [Deltaproteobacteria bacterium]|nr:MMPL family transporter [Deltaproteobacteria bacterium]
MTGTRIAELYAAWVIRWRVWILVTSLAIVAGGSLIVMTLPVHTDFSSLLPPDAPSVVELRKLEKRSRVVSTLVLMAESDDPQMRRAAAVALYERAQQISPDLVSKVSFDDKPAREFIWNNRWLFAPLEDLKVARDELRKAIDAAKLHGNPLYVDLEDEQVPIVSSSDGALDRKLAEAKAKHEQSGELVSNDGRAQMIVLYASVRSGDGVKNKMLLDQLWQIVDDVKATLPPGVEIGLAGDAVLDHAEHTAILGGMMLAIGVTVALVLLVLMLFFKSPVAVASMMWSLIVGTVITFAFTRLTIGELNIATAFLSSIVVGNGMNFGVVVGARYLEERRNGTVPDDAMWRTLRYTFTGTLAAALTAAVAYGSLVITDFRGFRHFGVIGGAGMVACWITAFCVLPAAFAIADRRGWIRARREPAIGKLLMRLVPRRPAALAFIMLAVTVAAGIETWRYFATEPFENNFRNLRSQSSAVAEETRWMKLSNHAFGRGVSAGFVMAVDDRAHVPPIVKRMREIDEGKEPKQRLFARVTSLDDLLPADQPEKIAILKEIRGLLTPDALDAMSDEDRARAEELRPPEGLKPLVEEALPEQLIQAFTERDGSRGKLIFALNGAGFDTWNSNHILRFASKVRALKKDPVIGEQVIMGSEAFVFADVLGTIERDGPRATFAALIGAIIVIIVILGFSRAAIVTLVCAATGTLLMLATASLFGIKVNFLDFVALPITIGIGIDYSVNIVAREREEGDARRALGTVGGAVVLCSTTTIIGYGSLLLSANLAIKSFGLAAIVGEITCLLVALALAPSLSWVLLRVRQKTEAMPSVSESLGHNPTSD